MRYKLLTSRIRALKTLRPLTRLNKTVLISGVFIGLVGGISLSYSIIHNQARLANAAGSLNGASTAVCNPSPCTQGTAVSHTMAGVADSDGANAQNVTGRTYYTERPNNLVGAAPLVVLPGSPTDTTGEPPYWEAESVTGKYELLFVSVTLHAGQPALPTTLADITAGANNCGTAGTSKCDDMPYLKAALDDALASENVDPSKVYIVGSSKAATFSETAICDTRTSSYFHGAVVISSSLTSNSPNNDQTVPAACPAITGNANTWDGGQWGGAPGLTPNTDLSVMWAFGTNDTVACVSTNPDCEETGGVNAKGYWGFSNPQLAGDANPPSPSGATALGNIGIGHVLGCSGTPSTNLVYGNTNKLTKKIYTGCTHANRATETLKVVNGGHAMDGLTGDDGLDLPGEAWTFLSTYGGTSSSTSGPTANVFVSPNGSDSGANCKRFATAVSNPDPSGATVCATFDKAYHVASSGDNVGILAGTFPYQRLTYDSTKTSSAHVVFAPYNGAVVHSDTIDFGQDQFNIQSAQHVTLQDIILDNVGGSVETWSTTNDVLLQNLTGHALQLLGGTNLTIKGGDWGKCTVTSDPATNCTSRMIGTNVTIDSANFHDVVHDSAQDPQNLNHTEGIFVRGCANCIINHSKFWHNTTFDVFLKNCCSLQANQSVKIYNSWFAAVGGGTNGNIWTGGTAVEVTNSIQGFQLIHNSFAENTAPVWAFGVPGDSWAGTNALTADNLYQRGGSDCATGMTYRGNVYIPFSQFTGQQSCDATEKKVSTFGYANYTQDSDLNYHLTAASAAIGAGTAQDSATAGSDMDGNIWPTTGIVDAGADEYTGTVTPPPPDSQPPTVSITSPSAGATLSGANNTISASASDNVGVVGVQFYLDYAGNPASNKLGAEDTTSPYSTTLNTTTLGNGAHSLTAIARDAAGNTAQATTVNFNVNNTAPTDTTPPSVPGNLQALITNPTDITIGWTASTDSGTNASGIAGYNIYRSSDGVNFSYISTTNLLAYDDTNLSPSTKYYYEVTAIDNAGNESAKTSAINATTAANPTPPPPTPPTPPTPTKKGDLNGDNQVNIFDLSILLSHYGGSGAGDLDGNGVVNIIDLSILLSNYGS